MDKIEEILGDFEFFSARGHWMAPEQQPEVRTAK